MKCLGLSKHAFSHLQTICQFLKTLKHDGLPAHIEQARHVPPIGGIDLFDAALRILYGPHSKPSLVGHPVAICAPFKKTLFVPHGENAAKAACEVQNLWQQEPSEEDCLGPQLIQRSHGAEGIEDKLALVAADRGRYNLNGQPAARRAEKSRRNRLSVNYMRMDSTVGRARTANREIHRSGTSANTSESPARHPVVGRSPTFVAGWSPMPQEL